MNELVAGTPDDNASTAIEHVGSPAQVMRAGTSVSRDLIQLLATEVATTAESERNRRLLTLVGAPVVAGVTALFGVMSESKIVMAVGVTAAAAIVLFASLVWGVRNRAVLDKLAIDTAVSPSVLTRAVRLVRKGAGPSAALREALESSSSSSSSWSWSSKPRGRAKKNSAS